ncbi:hypothetical protein BKA82DRAFT_992159 [Pisolithus tinctorius]|uniref:Uncharacterized protein n=1 Tax=Pisolithus tinctorius Marx 270 TaxID=870435 RepID=A0A0C3PX06_PISTI|nr:hypothetical protein BKA82DRAFT_992159 [Pisolithus tinctorius]KIO13911.1 hypothetical protein M404DRAFT_992159 [Pisolithus tinctorius Marx 270]
MLFGNLGYALAVGAVFLGCLVRCGCIIRMRPHNNPIAELGRGSNTFHSKDEIPGVPHYSRLSPSQDTD